MSNDDEPVRERAYILWEQAGRPDGRSLEFWLAAIHQLDAAAELPKLEVAAPQALDAEPEEPAFRAVEKPAAE
jgi:hypothetical protein